MFLFIALMLVLVSVFQNPYMGLFSELDGLVVEASIAKVCADDVFQRDDESSTTKPSSSEKTPTSKSPT